MIVWQNYMEGYRLRAQGWSRLSRMASGITLNMWLDHLQSLSNACLSQTFELELESHLSKHVPFISNIKFYFYLSARRTLTRMYIPMLYMIEHI